MHRFGRHLGQATFVLAGAVAGVAVDRAFDEVRLEAIALGMLAVAVGAMFAHLDEERRRETLMAIELKNLRTQIGLTVNCQTIEQINHYSTVNEDIVTAAVAAAEREVLVVDLLGDHGQRPDDGVAPRHLSQHMTVLLDRAADQTGPIVYKRICQVAEPGEPLGLMTSTEFSDHCREMCRLRETGEGRVALRVTKMRHPYKFILIDRRTLVLQLHRVTPDDRLTIDKELVIYDSSGDLVRIFADIWDDLGDQPETRIAGLDEFPNEPKFA